MIGLSLHHLHYAHDSASLATACSPSTARLMSPDVSHASSSPVLSFLWSLASDVLEHRPLSAHRKKSYEHPRALAQPLLSWQTPQELVFVVLRHSPSSPLLPLGSRPHRPLPNGCASSRNFLLMASSSLSGLALPIKLSSSISRINAVRRRRVRAMFLAVSTHQEGRDVNHLSTRSNVALANQDAGVVNGLLQATTSLWSASVVR